MDKKEENKDKEGCSCGSCRHCCGGRSALVLVLLLIGGLIGYAIGHCRGGGYHCPYSSMSESAPATPPAK